MADTTASSSDLQAEFNLLVAQVRQLAPPSCCPHNDPPCIGCGLDWLIEQGIPIRLTEDGDLEHVRAGDS